MSVPADRMRRRSSVPTLEDLRTAEIAPLAPRRNIFEQTGDEISGAVRDAVRDPMDALGRATAPLPGAGGAVARAGPALGSVSRARVALGAAGTAGATVPLAATLARDEALASERPAGAGVRRRGGAPMEMTPGVTQRSRGSANSFTYSDGTTVGVEGGATAPAAQQERVQATGANDADRIGLRGRQGAIIANPNAMSTVDRLAQLQHTFKGSPSLRRLAAEQIMGEDQRREDNFQGAQQENAQADLEQAKMQQTARTAFADRRLRADEANQTSTDRRRANDQDYSLGSADIMLKSEELKQARAAAAAKVAGTANARTDALVQAELERDPTLTREQAIVRAGNLAALEGEDTQNSATGRAADALASGALDQGVRGRQRGGNFVGRAADAFGRFGLNTLAGSDLSSADDVRVGEVTPDAYSARGLGLRERVMAPFVSGFTGDDVVLTDRNGRSTAAPRSSLGGLTPEEFTRRGLLRRSTVE